MDLIDLIFLTLNTFVLTRTGVSTSFVQFVLIILVQDQEIYTFSTISCKYYLFTP